MPQIDYYRSFLKTQGMLEDTCKIIDIYENINNKYRSILIHLSATTDDNNLSQQISNIVKACDEIIKETK